MKANILTLLLLSLVCFSAQAQDDDMYFMSSKKKAQKTAPARVSSATVYNDADDEADADGQEHEQELQPIWLQVRKNALEQRFRDLRHVRLFLVGKELPARGPSRDSAACTHRCS